VLAIPAVCEVSCPSGVEAYVDPPLFRAFSSKNKVHLCAPFFELDASSLTVVDRKAGVSSLSFKDVKSLGTHHYINCVRLLCTK
jgi:hypothetical protein